MTDRRLAGPNWNAREPVGTRLPRHPLGYPAAYGQRVLERLEEQLKGHVADKEDEAAS